MRVSARDGIRLLIALVGLVVERRPSREDVVLRRGTGVHPVLRVPSTHRVEVFDQ
jgi:hypothetical protein